MGIEWEAEDNNCLELINHLNNIVIPKSKNLKNRSIPIGSGIGIKPVSKSGSQRHIRKAIEHAKRLSGNKRHVTLVHKGNIMKFTEGAFRDWGYELAVTEFREDCITERESWILDNIKKNPEITIENNARKIEPGFDKLTNNKKAFICEEIKEVIASISNSHGDGKWKQLILVDDRIADSIFNKFKLDLKNIQFLQP